MTETHLRDVGARFSWSAAIWAGLIAGLAFVIMEMILVATVGGGSAWGPPRMMAAMVMGKDVLPGPENPPTFDMGIVLAGMIVHFVLSIVLALALAVILAATGVGTGMAIAIGVVFGLAVYVVNFTGSRRSSRGSRMRATGSRSSATSSSVVCWAAATPRSGGEALQVAARRPGDCCQGRRRPCRCAPRHTGSSRPQ